jgi:hypothetical protein
MVFECKVTYSGGWAPSARWQHVDINGEILSEKATNFATSPKFVHDKQLRFTLSVKVTKKMKGTKYRCTIYFDISQKSNRTTADNIPDYNFTWTSDVLSVSDTASTGGNSGELNASHGNLHR